MRIGLISYEYPPQQGLGGVGTYTFRLAGALGRAGYEVAVLAGPSEQADIPQSNVTVHRIEAKYEPPLGLSGLRFLYWQVFARLMNRAHPLVWHWLRWDMASGAALREIHRRTPLDVIEAPEHAANGLIVAKMHRWPMVVRLHGPWDLFFGINRTTGAAMNRLLATLERRSTQRAQLVTAPSRTMSAFMHERWQMEQAPDVVPNFMDVPLEAAPLPDAQGPQRIVCAGRIERFKGQDTLVKAFVRIAHRHPQAELLLLGPDQWSPHARFEQLVNAWAPDGSVRRRIRMEGRVPLDEVLQTLNSAAVSVISSSGFESFSFSTLEAMAAARPIVGSYVGAIPELLDQGRCGLLASPGNVQQFADALDRLLSDRELCQRLSMAAHQRALRQYDTAAVLPAVIAAYQKARRRFYRFGPAEPAQPGYALQCA